MGSVSGKPHRPSSALPPASACGRGWPESHFGENQLSPGSLGISPLPTAHPRLLQQTSVRASTRSYTRFTLAMGSSPGFGSTARDVRPQPPSPCSDSVSLWRRVSLPQPRHGRSLAGSFYKKHAISLPIRATASDSVSAHGFRICFTPRAGVLFTIPSRYCALSVACGI